MPTWGAPLTTPTPESVGRRAGRMAERRVIGTAVQALPGGRVLYPVLRLLGMSQYLMAIAEFLLPILLFLLLPQLIGRVMQTVIDMTTPPPTEYNLGKILREQDFQTRAQMERERIEYASLNPGQ